MKDVRIFIPYLLLFTIGNFSLQDSAGQKHPALTKSPCDTIPVLKIGLIADPQYCDCDPLGNRYYRETLTKLPDAVDTLNFYQVDFVMNLGDMIDRYENSYDSVIQFYRELTMPYYNLLGNHAFEEVSEAYMDSMLQRYEMPNFYYDFSYLNWRFLVLDGTELAEYSRYLHPELAGEGDSLWQQVQGQVNAFPWNGGIGRNQQLWIRSKLQEALEAEENVILFCHFPVYPYLMQNGLWNDSAIVDVLEDYPNVVAYINGHEHTGDYGFRNGIHYFTQKAMVDYPDKNSFSILEIFRHEIRIKGFGNVQDTVWYYSDIKKKPLSFNLTGSVLHYSDHTGSFIGKFLPDTSQAFSQVTYSFDTSLHENNYFMIADDLLLFNTDIDISALSEIQIAVQAEGCGFDTTSKVFQITFDTVSAIFHYPLADTMISLYESLIIIPGFFLTDYSRNGLDYMLISSDTSVISTVISDTAFYLVPGKAGSAEIDFYITDAYLGKTYLHQFIIEVYDPFNHPPFVIDTTETDFFVFPYDSLFINLSELFSDPDGDNLTYNVNFSDTIPFTVLLTDSVLTIFAGSAGRADFEITANDGRGGISSLVLSIVINRPPQRISNYPEYEYPVEELMCVYIDLDTMYADPDGDTLTYSVTGSDYPVTIADESFLEICPEITGSLRAWLEISDGKNGFLADSLTIIFLGLPVAVKPTGYSAFQSYVTIYPNPSSGIFYLLLNEKVTGTILIKVTDIQGRELHKESFMLYSDNHYPHRFTLSEKTGNGIYLLQVILPGSRIIMHKIQLMR